MAKEQYHSENFKKADDLLAQHGEVLKKSHADMVKLLESLMKSQERTFRGDKGDVDLMRNMSSQMNTLFEDYEKNISDLTEKLKKQVEINEDLANAYQISSEEIGKALELIKKRNDADRSYDDKRYEKTLIEYEINSKEAERGRILASGGDTTDVDNEINDLYDQLNKVTIGVDDAEKKFEDLEKSIRNSALATNILSESIKVGTKENEGINNLNQTASISNTVANNAQQMRQNLINGNNELKNGNKLMGSLYQLIKSAFGIVIDASNKWMEIEDRVKKVGRSIGMSHEQVRGYQQDIMRNYGSMAAKLGMTIDELTSFQEKYTKATGRAVQLSKEQVTVLASASKLMGEVATNKIVENMDNFGASTKTATSYLALNHARARAMGLDAQKASEAFADNVKLASKYTFSEGVNGISKMTLLSQKLKFNMESVANAAEKFETIEGAISTAANLQMLGGTFAQQFSNPLEAMNMAMLDMEGFTDKVINSVKGKATFNRETGQIDMSAMDKRFIKEASKQLGISYDEMYNMAVQPTKIREIERELRTDQNFDETEKAFLANKAEYDPESKSFKITYFDEQGNEQQADISKISKDQLRQIRQQHDVDKAIYGDVHSIHGMLQDYLRSEGFKSTSMKEHLTGIKEASATTMANFADNWMHTLSGWTKDLTSSDNVGELVATTVGTLTIGKAMAKPFMGDIASAGKSTLGKGLGKLGNLGGGSGNPVGGAKIGVKGGALVTVGLSAYNAYDAYNTYDKQKEEIENSSLSAEDKAKAKTEAKKERNKSYGNAAGSTAGALLAMGAGAKIGAAVGTAIPIPVVGTAVGALAGAAIGLGASWLGGKIGESIGEAVTSEEEVQNENAQPLASVTNDTTTNIINGEREKEYLAVSHISHGVDSVNGYLSQMVSGNGRTLPVSNGKTNNKNVINGDTYLSSNEKYGNTNGFMYNVNPINNNLSLTNGTYASNNIISTPTIGTPTYVNPKKDNNYYLANNTNTPTNNNINLNVNGSLKLIGDNSVGNIDINTLLKDSNFINELKSILLQSLNQSNGISSPKGAYANMVKTADNNFNYGTLKSL